MKGIVTRVDCDPGIIPKLVFYGKFDNDSDKQATIYAISGELHLRTPKGNYRLGSLPTKFGRFNIMPKQVSDIQVEADVPLEMLNAIEEHREGDDIFFGVLVELLCAYSEPQQQPTLDNMRSDRFWLVSEGFGDRIEIPQSKWVKMLERFGYGTMKLMEFRIPPPPLGTILDKALTFLDTARNHLNLGNNEETMVSCRKAIEVLTNAINSKDIELETVVGSSSKSEKIITLVKKTKDYMHLGAHEGVQITRRDAEISISLTAAILSYFSKELTTKR